MCRLGEGISAVYGGEEVKYEIEKAEHYLTSEDPSAYD